MSYIKMPGNVKVEWNFFQFGQKRDYITITEGMPRHTDYKVAPAFSPIPRVVLYLCTGQRE
jgi:hypothetical protein